MSIELNIAKALCEQGVAPPTAVDWESVQRHYKTFKESKNKTDRISANETALFRSLLWQLNEQSDNWDYVFTEFYHGNVYLKKRCYLFSKSLGGWIESEPDHKSSVYTESIARQWNKSDYWSYNHYKEEGRGFEQFDNEVYVDIMIWTRSGWIILKRPNPYHVVLWDHLPQWTERNSYPTSGPFSQWEWLEEWFKKLKSQPKVIEKNESNEDYVLFRINELSQRLTEDHNTRSEMKTLAKELNYHQSLYDEIIQKSANTENARKDPPVPEFFRLQASTSNLKKYVDSDTNK